MSADIIELAAIRASRGNVKSVPAAILAGGSSQSEQSPRFHFWSGASGKRYVHTVYSLFDCPPVGLANYVLVRRSPNGQRTLLAVGRVAHQAASQNLAEIRQRGATLGADEVHVHFLAASANDAQAVEVDLKTAQFASRLG